MDVFGAPQLNPAPSNDMIGDSLDVSPEEARAIEEADEYYVVTNVGIDADSRKRKWARLSERAKQLVREYRRADREEEQAKVAAAAQRAEAERVAELDKQTEAQRLAEAHKAAIAADPVAAILSLERQIRDINDRLARRGL